jgi:proton glutamate symport protein
MTTDQRSRGTSLTAWSLAALAAGLALGLLCHRSGSPAYEALARAVEPLGELWLSALQMTVLPLVVAHTLAAIGGTGTERSVGALGGRAMLLFVAMLAAAGLLTVALAPTAVAWYPVDRASVAALQSATPVPQAARDAAVAGPGSLGEWVATLLPRNLFEAARRGDVLALLLFTTLFAVAVTRLPAEQRDPLARAFRGAAAAMLIVVRWLLWFTPVGVFAYILALALRAGSGAAGMLGAYVLVVCGFLLLCTALLYPATALLGRTSVRAFARAVAPAQLVAVSTRSSIAALPALVDGGRRQLGLPETATSFALPLGASVFKLNRMISSPVKLLFLAHVYGVPLTPGAVATFMATVMLLSFSSVGVPGGGVAFKTLPAYLAAGVPIEGVVIAETVEAVPDIFKTLLNVTANMSAATMLSRRSRVPHAAPVAAPVTPAATPVTPAAAPAVPAASVPRLPGPAPHPTADVA